MAKADCRKWHAWLNTMPPKPDDLSVVGDVVVPNPGVVPQLTMREPQGINPGVLMLDLNLVQQPGMWPQVITCVQVRFDRVLPDKVPYTAVEVFQDGERVAFIDQIDIVT